MEHLYSQSPMQVKAAYTDRVNNGA